jgi:peptidoglycan/LPS O-acetylase OafA/YrhL
MIDVNRALSLLGTGVNLFFVISGFCMYMMYDARIVGFSWGSYRTLIASRARRIMPAFSGAVLFAALLWWAKYGEFPVGQVLEHLAFVHILIPDGNQLATPFWSLATEWHFYLLLPLLVVMSRRYGYMRTLLVAVSASILYRCVESTFVPASDFQLPSHLTEFVLGIAVARLVVAGRALPRFLKGPAGVALGLGVMLVGRFLMSDLALRSSVHVIVYAANVPLLALGYSLILWSVVSSDSLAARLLRKAPMQGIGRISYSFYLWHWFPGVWIGRSMIEHFGPKPFVPIAATIVAILAVIPIAWTSYSLFEAPYFAKRARDQKAAHTKLFADALADG